MKPILLLLCLMLYSVQVFAEPQQYWPNRPNVIRAAERLSHEVERFDEALHDSVAPSHVTQKVHHFEETVAEFLQLAISGSYQMASSEFQHIRSDFNVIRQEVMSHPNLMQNYKVAQEFQHMRTAYRSLDHEMYMHLKSRWTLDRVKKLSEDLKVLEEAH